jgi:hypothetical protein
MTDWKEAWLDATYQKTEIDIKMRKWRATALVGWFAVGVFVTLYLTTGC